MKIQSANVAAKSPLSRGAAPAPTSEETSTPKEAFSKGQWQEAGRAAAMFGGLALVTSAIGTTGKIGLAGVGVGSFALGGVASKGLDSGPGRAAWAGLTVISTASAAAGTLFGGYGVAGATAVGVGLGLYTGLRN